MHLGAFLVQQELVKSDQLQIGLRRHVVVATLCVEVVAGSLSFKSKGWTRETDTECFERAMGTPFVEVDFYHRYNFTLLTRSTAIIYSVISLWKKRYSAFRGGTLIVLA